MVSEELARLRDYEALSAMESHGHDEPSLNIIIGGGFNERIGRQERSYRRGHIAFCPAGVEHSQCFGSRGARQIILRPKPEWLTYLAEGNVALADSPHLNSLLFAQLGDRLARELATPDPFAKLARDGLIAEIFAAFGRGYGNERTALRPPNWLLAARDFIHASGGCALDLDEVATAAGRHPIHLCRQFKLHFGMSVGSYVRALRIEKARRLIIAKRLTLTEVALECGFSSHAHLCREFRAQLGMTPSQFAAKAPARGQS